MPSVLLKIENYFHFLKLRIILISLPKSNGFHACMVIIFAEVLVVSSLNFRYRLSAVRLAKLRVLLMTYKKVEKNI